MRRLIPYLFFIWLAVGYHAFGQVAVAGTDSPYKFSVLPGGQMQLFVNVTGGTLNTCTVTNPGGGATITNPNNQCTATVLFSAAKTGTCSISGSTYSSTNTTSITFTSIDDATKSYTYVVNICQATGTAYTIPAHQDTFTNTPRTVQSFVQAVDETGTWTLTGTGCTSPDLNMRDLLVTGATANTTCTAVYTANAGGSTSTSYVDIHGAPPSYTSTPDGTEPEPCDNSLSRFTTVLDVGPSQTYHTLQAAYPNGTHVAGTLIRLHNEASGSGSTTYNEYVQENISGTLTAPIRLCGVPNAAGYLPIIDGTNATSSATTAPNAAAGFGLFNVWPSLAGTGSPYGNYQSGPYGPAYIEVAGIHMRNIGAGVYFYPPGSPTVTAISRSGNIVTATFSVPNAFACFSGGFPSVIISGVAGGTTSFNTPGNQPFTITSASALGAGNSQVLTGTITGGAANAYAGYTIFVNGFGNEYNDGVFTITASTTTTITITNNGSAPGAETQSAIGQIIFQALSCPSSTQLTWAQTGANESGTVSGSSIVMEPNGQGNACVNQRAGRYLSVFGNHMDSCAIGVGTYDNGNNLWAQQTLYDYFRGNQLQGCGTSGSFLDHCFYNQTWYTVTEFNWINNYNPLASGSCMKMRGVETIIRYNWLNCGAALSFDYVEDQDNGQYMNITQYFGGGVPQGGDTLGANGVQSFNQGWQRDLNYGNICYTATGCPRVHYAEDHDAGPAMRQGQLFFYSNTMDQLNILFATNSASYQPVLIPQGIFANNGLYSTNSLGIGFIIQAQTIATWQTNVISAAGSPNPPAISFAIPQYGGNYNAGASGGWSNGCDTSPCYILDGRIDWLQTGYPTAGNFIQASATTYPYSTSTFVPISGSPMLMAAAAVTGFPSTSPVRFFFRTSDNTLQPRTDIVSGTPTTIGAVPGSGSPASSSVIFNGNIKLSGKVVVQ